MKKKLSLLVALLLALALVTAACANGNGNDDGNGGDAGAEQVDTGDTGDAGDADVVEMEEMTISVMFFDSGIPGGVAHPNTGETSVVVTDLHEEIFARTPNVTWEFEALQGDTEGFNSYLLRGAAGTLPDISMLDGYWVAAFASQGFTTAMERVLTTEQLDIYYPAFRNMYRGETHGLVMSTNFNGVLWYRISHMEELGLTMPPPSWDALRDYAYQLTIPGERYGFVMPMARSEHTNVCLLGFYWGAQIPFVDENNVAVFNNPTSIALFELLRGMYDDGSLPHAALTMMYDDAERLFIIEQASILQHGAWLASRWPLTVDFADDVGVSPLPPYAGTGISSQNAGGWGLSVTTDDEAKFPAIAEFLSVMLLEPEWVILRLAEASDIPVTSNIPSEAVTWLPEQYADTIMAMLPTANTRPIVQIYPDASLEFVRAMQEAVTGVTDPETALAEAVERVAEIARESGWGE